MAVANLAERLTTIIHYLNRGESIHVKELATEFSISERQIQKDIKLFSSFCDIEHLGKQRYRMKKNRKAVNLENKDIEIAIALMKSLQKSALPQMTDYINKALEDDNLYSDIFLFNIDNETLANMEAFYKLLDAIRSQLSCSYVYTKKDGSSKTVYVHPYRIANLSGLWYILAYDVEAEILKSYHINSISALKVAEKWLPDIQIVDNPALNTELINSLNTFLQN